MSAPTYQASPWFAVLQQAVRTSSRAAVATRLGVSAPMVTQVLNATGKYGAGQASCEQLAQRVLHVFGPPYACPHLTDRESTLVLIDADYCRATAHAPPPIGAPQAMRHWQACRTCEHKHWTAPFPPRQPGRPRPRAGTDIAPCSPTEDRLSQSTHTTESAA